MPPPEATAVRPTKRGLEQEDTRIPVTVITGFLGSGKTTLVNHILTSNTHGKRIAVIENEFGEVGIDDALVLNAREEILEMNNGCICCTVRGDLIKILTRLAKRRASGTPLDAVLVETTGLADPAPVAQSFFVDDFVKEHYRLDSILTVVDCKHLVLHLDDDKPEGVENEAVEQLAFADVVLLNKTDLVDTEQKQSVIQRIKGINATAKIIETVQSRVEPLDKILGIRAFDLTRVLEAEPDFLEAEGADHQHDASVTSVGVTIKEPLDGDKLQSWLSDLLRTRGADLFRSKGVLNIKGAPDRYVFQGVHMLLTFGGSHEAGDPDGPKGGAPRNWAPDEERISRLVFIGRNLNRAELENGLRKCIAK